MKILDSGRLAPLARPLRDKPLRRTLIPDPTLRPEEAHMRVLKMVGTAALWIVQILAAAAFVAIGIAKFASPEWARNFARWGYPDGFYLVIGALEVGGAMLLLVPKLSSYAARAARRDHGRGRRHARASPRDRPDRRAAHVARGRGAHRRRAPAPRLASGRARAAGSGQPGISSVGARCAQPGTAMARGGVLLHAGRGALYGTGVGRLRLRRPSAVVGARVRGRARRLGALDAARAGRPAAGGARAALTPAAGAAAGGPHPRQSWHRRGQAGGGSDDRPRDHRSRARAVQPAQDSPHAA